MSDHFSQKALRCPICDLDEVNRIIEISQVPVHCNVLHSTREEALAAPRGNITLDLCPNCGHVFNSAYEPELTNYFLDYENSLQHSPRFQSYALSLARNLVKNYDLYDRDIVEIGSGNGHFLKLLCELGNNRGIGFDPSSSGNIAQIGEDTNEKISFINDLYSEKYASTKTDFICCRHVLEHIQYPMDFVLMVRAAIGNRRETIIMFEVPNAPFIFHQLSIWDIIYEHCSYFCSASLEHLFEKCGFEVLRIADGFDGQFLRIEARPCTNDQTFSSLKSEIVTRMTEDGESFKQTFGSRLDSWRKHLEQFKRSSSKTAIWGAGSKGVTFLNLLDTQGIVEFVIDLNPRKHGNYVAGAGQKIMPPSFLRHYAPDIVIIMNAVYEREIRALIRKMNLNTKLICV